MGLGLGQAGLWVEGCRWGCGGRLWARPTGLLGLVTARAHPPGSAERSCPPARLPILGMEAGGRQDPSLSAGRDCGLEGDREGAQAEALCGLLAKGPPPVRYCPPEPGLETLWPSGGWKGRHRGQVTPRAPGPQVQVPESMGASSLGHGASRGRGGRTGRWGPVGMETNSPGRCGAAALLGRRERAGPQGRGRRVRRGAKEGDGGLVAGEAAGSRDPGPPGSRPRGLTSSSSGGWRPQGPTRARRLHCRQGRDKRLRCVRVCARAPVPAGRKGLPPTCWPPLLGPSAGAGGGAVASAGSGSGCMRSAARQVTGDSWAPLGAAPRVRASQPPRTALLGHLMPVEGHGSSPRGRAAASLLSPTLDLLQLSPKPRRGGRGCCPSSGGWRG